jgi:hypothetical protein
MTACMAEAGLVHAETSTQIKRADTLSARFIKSIFLPAAEHLLSPCEMPLDSYVPPSMMNGKFITEKGTQIPCLVPRCGGPNGMPSLKS